ncbi:MAG: hypothetical protein DCE88_12830, partial [Betaproteobacteria bacterium]
IGTVGEVLGGDSVSSGDSGAGSALPTDALPLDMLTGALPISTDGGGLGPLDLLTGALPV